ncbi:carboxymuconolactone decarboxylase family protein [Amorphus sp. 3PC139-8]|uniref:carboxymuconolactone decarboxylase family protein n=1 Tax=Amorphus sp. 3PC139-8 TaxID=2735676 RepID=UPI00345D1D5C
MTDYSQQGLELRRQMFGKAGADDHIANASEFMQPVQDLVTRVCFGEIWQRPHLDLKMRSMLTLAMLVAQGRTHEIRIHTRGALANGATKEELKELFLHSFPYIGLPLMIDGILACEDEIRKVEAGQAIGDLHEGDHG